MNNQIALLTYSLLFAIALPTSFAGANSSPMIAAQSGLCVDVTGGSPNSGTRVQQYGCNGSIAQNFTFDTRDSTVYAIHSGTGKATCLDYGASSHSGLQVLQVNCSSSKASQQWKVAINPDGTVTLHSGDGKGCLDVSGASTAPSAKIITWSCHGRLNQKFKITALTSAPAPGPAPTSVPSTSPPAQKIPQDAIILHPGANLQQAVDNAANGSTFYLTAGIYARQQLHPKDGMTFIGELLDGKPAAILDGQGVTPHSFETLNTAPQNVTIQGIATRNYASPSDLGSIHGDNSINWTLDNMEIYGNVNGIQLGQGMILRNSFIHDNQIVGIGSFHADGALLENNEVAYNNTSHQDPDTATGGAAGIKLFEMNGATVRGNYVHDNNAPGIWFDGNCLNVLIENNRVIGNDYRGIMYEISYGPTVIRGNTIQNNAVTRSGGSAAGIWISNSQGVEIYNNAISGNPNGITLGEGPRGVGTYGEWLVRNISVHDNRIAQPSGAAAGLFDWGSTGLYGSDRKIQFNLNSYDISGNPSPFLWSDPVTAEQWKSNGMDSGSLFNQ